MENEKEKHNNRSGVLICGAYGMGNAGDEAILEAIVAEMREIDGEMPITVLTRRPAETAARLGVRALHTFDIPGFLAAARRSLLYVNGGGSLIQDVTSRRSLWFYLFTLSAAKRLGCRVMMYGCGIGPVKYLGDVRHTRRVLNASVDAITLREPDSLAELGRFGVTEPQIALSSDPALSLPACGGEESADALRNAGADPAGRYICFALRRWPGFSEKTEALARAARYAYERYGLTPFFLSINHLSDGEAAGQVIARMGDTPYVLLPDPMSSGRTVGVLSRMDIVVSMRLHGLIFAAGQGVPLVGISYDPKVTSFLRCVEGFCVGLEDASAEKLCGLIDEAAAMRDNKDRLAANVRRLRELEKRNAQVARGLLGREEG